MKRHTLLDDDFYDFFLVGIKTRNLPDYEVVYNINKHFQCNFNRVNDLDIYKKENKYCFSCFEWIEPTLENEFYLIKNLANPTLNNNVETDLFGNSFQQDYLISELNEYQYILKSYLDAKENPILQLSLSSNYTLFQFKPIELNALKSKKNLIF